jgi:hypothetical protein
VAAAKYIVKVDIQMVGLLTSGRLRIEFRPAQSR